MFTAGSTAPVINISYQTSLSFIPVLSHLCAAGARFASYHCYIRQIIVTVIVILTDMML